MDLTPEQLAAAKTEWDKDISHEEVAKVTRAMKDPKFKEHFEAYIDEISDPKHRAEYETYLEQLEHKGEMPEGRQLLRAEPGVCVKSSMKFKSGQEQKLFINVCFSKRIKDCEFRPVEDQSGHNVSLPYSLSPPRPDQDKRGLTCSTCDVAVGEGTFLMAKRNPQLLRLIIDTTASALSSHYFQGHEEVKKDYKILQMQCKGGKPMPMSVREEDLKDPFQKKPKAKVAGDAVTPHELQKMKRDAMGKKGQDKNEQMDKDKNEEGESDPLPAPSLPAQLSQPKHRLIYISGLSSSSRTSALDASTYAERPGETAPLPEERWRRKDEALKLVIELPGVKRAGEIGEGLDVQEDNVTLEVCKNKKVVYYLDIALPRQVLPEQANARFLPGEGVRPSCLEVVVPIKEEQRGMLEEEMRAWDVLQEEQGEAVEDANEELREKLQVADGEEREEAIKESEETKDHALEGAGSEEKAVWSRDAEENVTENASFFAREDSGILPISELVEMNAHNEHGSERNVGEVSPLVEIRKEGKASGGRELLEIRSQQEEPEVKKHFVEELQDREHYEWQKVENIVEVSEEEDEEEPKAQGGHGYEVPLPASLCVSQNSKGVSLTFMFDTPLLHEDNLLGQCPQGSVSEDSTGLSLGFRSGVSLEIRGSVVSILYPKTWAPPGNSHQAIARNQLKLQLPFGRALDASSYLVNLLYDFQNQTKMMDEVPTSEKVLQIFGFKVIIRKSEPFDCEWELSALQCVASLEPAEVEDEELCKPSEADHISSAVHGEPAPAPLQKDAHLQPTEASGNMEPPEGSRKAAGLMAMATNWECNLFLEIF